VESTVKTSIAMDLVGAEIKDVWDGRGKFYAVAVMDKAKTAQIYTRMIQENLNIIDRLTAISGSGRNSVDGFARFRFAFAATEVNEVFANVLVAIGAPVPESPLRPEDYRRAAEEIKKNIPVSVSVEGDESGRIRGTAPPGLETGGGKHPREGTGYQVLVQLSLSETSLPTQNGRFVRYSLQGNFVDTAAPDVLFPYNVVGWQSHPVLSLAQTKAVQAAVNKIREEYPQALSAYLSRVLPQK
jgi:hypothetical protein